MQIITEQYDASTRIKLIAYDGQNAITAPIISASLSASYSDGDEFSIGSAQSATIQITFGAIGMNLHGKTLRVVWKFDPIGDSSTHTEYPLITGTVCDRPMVSGGNTIVELHDALYTANEEYTPASNPCSVLDAFTALAAQIGVGLNTAHISTSPQLPHGTVALAGVTRADAAGALAALCGGNAVIGRDGRLGVSVLHGTGTAVTAYGEGNDTGETTFTPSGISFIVNADMETETAYRAGDGSIVIQNDLATQAITDSVFTIIRDISVVSGSYRIPGGIIYEPGDIIAVTTGDGAFNVGVSSMTLDYDGGTSLTLMSVSEPLAEGMTGAITKSVEHIKTIIAHDRNEMEQNHMDFLSLIGGSSAGVYETREQSSTGGVVLYYHDKPVLAESERVIKITSDGIGVSTNGVSGSYENGYSIATGSMFVDYLQAVGINASWINAGSIVVKTESGAVVLSVNAETGYMTATRGTIGGFQMYPDGMNGDSVLSGGHTILHGYDTLTEENPPELRFYDTTAKSGYGSVRPVVDEATGRILGVQLVGGSNDGEFPGFQLISGKAHCDSPIESSGYIQSVAISSDPVACKAQNALGAVQLHVSAAGNRGLYDVTANRWMVYSQNGKNEVDLPYGVTMYGHATKVGTVVNYPGAGTGVGIESGKWMGIASIELDPGVWTITATASLVGGNYRNGLSISTNANNYDVNATTYSNNLSWANVSRNVSISAKTTFYMVAYQASGSDATCIPRAFTAIQIA